LLKHDTSQPEEIADKLDIARSTVEWHLSNLLAYDIATKRTTSPGDNGDGCRVVVELTDRSAVYRQLREIEPGFTDRLVDRFTRLADELLAD